MARLIDRVRGRRGLALWLLLAVALAALCLLLSSTALRAYRRKDWPVLPPPRLCDKRQCAAFYAEMRPRLSAPPTRPRRIALLSFYSGGSGPKVHTRQVISPAQQKSASGLNRAGEDRMTRSITA